MRFHRSSVHRLALILAILAVTCEISWASKQCKAVVMDVHVKKCRLGTERTKRGLERLDLQKYNTKHEAKGQEGPDYSQVKDATLHGVPRKRQLSAGQVSGIALPIVAEAINGAAKVQAYAAGSETGYYELNPSLIRSTLGWPEYYRKMPYPFGRGLLRDFRAPAITDDLDFDLNDEELDELYNGIYERLPRASKDEAWKVFLETASKCCQNVDRCLKETTHVPCLGNQMALR